MWWLKDVTVIDPTQKLSGAQNVLIKDGVLQGYMGDR